LLAGYETDFRLDPNHEKLALSDRYLNILFVLTVDFII